MLDRFMTRTALPLSGVMLAVAVLVSACGGGSGDSDTDVGNAGVADATSYTEGQVTGYGSIVVNGVRFDDRAAKVVNEDDSAGHRADIKVGMWVEIEGADVNRDRGVGRAVRVRWANEFIGPVTAVDTAASTFVMFGQTIEVKEATQFEGFSGGLSAVAVGNVAEVHGYFNAATGRYVATRVEAEPNPEAYRLRGIVSNLDTTAKTFKLGSETINYAGVDASTLPEALVNGRRVRVVLQTTQNSAGQWVATRIKHGVHKPRIDRLESEVEGSVSAWTSATQFEINGMPVDASTAIFRDGQVSLGDHVEAKGKMVDGVLKAVIVKKEDHSGDTDRNELHGTVSTANTSTDTFVLHHEVHGDITVSYDHILRFEHGNESKLVPGAKVEVRGRLMLNNVLQAARVKFED